MSEKKIVAALLQHMIAVCTLGVKTPTLLGQCLLCCAELSYHSELSHKLTLQALDAADDAELPEDLLQKLYDLGHKHLALSYDAKTADAWMRAEYGHWRR